MEIVVCKTAAQIAATYVVMRQLRPHLENEAVYVHMVQSMLGEGYHLVAAFQDGACRGVTGYRIETRLSRGKLMYVDDLVTDENARSGGVGKTLLDWLIQQARQMSCSCVNLDSATHRHGAHKFYLREGFRIGMFNFMLDLD